MTGVPDVPPRGLAWTVTLAGRLLAYVLAVAALAVSIYVGYLRIELAECLNARDLADRTRTAAIARVTDVERRADLDLLRGAGTAEVVQLRARAVAARESTDRVRSEFPAPDLQPCK